MRVLHVTQPTRAGVAAYVAAACADQQNRGWRVAVACPESGPLVQELDRLGVPHFPWPATRSPGVQTLKEAFLLRGVVGKFGPDVVHLHSAKAGLAGRLIGPGEHRTIFQPHAWAWHAASPSMALASRYWERLAARWTDQIICVGDGEARQGRAAGVRAAYRVVLNGVKRGFLT